MAAFGGWRLTRTGVLFVIGIIVLAGLVTGGVFLVKNRGEAVRRDEAVKIAEQNLKDQSEAAAKARSDSEKANDAADTSEQTAAATPQSTNTVATTGANASQLPQTGPDDLKAVADVIIVAMLALSAAFYVSSRRAASRL